MRSKNSDNVETDVSPVLYREIFAFLAGSEINKRPHPSSSIDLPRPLARGLVHFFGLLRSDTLRRINDDLADQIAQSLSRWFAALWVQLWRNTLPRRSDSAASALPLGGNAPEEPLQRPETGSTPEAALTAIRLAWPEAAERWDLGLRTLERLHNERTKWEVVRNLDAYREVLERNRREELVERALRLVTTPLADHLNETLPSIADNAERIRSVFHRPGRWDIFEPIWDDVAWDTLTSVAEFADEEPDLASLAQRIVRGVETAAERRVWTSAEVVEVRREERERGYGEVTGLGSASSPQFALPSELALLAFPETETLFFRKRAEHAILALESDRFAPVEERHVRTEWRQRTVTPALGPVIVCVDTSGSMSGEPEQIAAATVLHLVREGLTHRRRVDVIALRRTLQIASFDPNDHDTTEAGTEEQPEEKRKPQPPGQTPEPRATDRSAEIRATEPVRVAPESAIDLEAIVRRSVPGGADISPALEAALSRCEERNEVATTDLVIVSDIHFPKLGPDHLNRLYRLQSRGWVRFHAVTINRQPIYDPMNIFDYRWHYNTAEVFDFRPRYQSRRIGITGDGV